MVRDRGGRPVDREGVDAALLDRLGHPQLVVAEGLDGDVAALVEACALERDAQCERLAAREVGRADLLALQVGDRLGGAVLEDVDAEALVRELVDGLEVRALAETEQDRLAGRKAGVDVAADDLLDDERRALGWLYVHVEAFLGEVAEAFGNERRKELDRGDVRQHQPDRRGGARAGSPRERRMQPLGRSGSGLRSVPALGDEPAPDEQAATARDAARANGEQANGGETHEGTPGEPEGDSDVGWFCGHPPGAGEQ